MRKTFSDIAHQLIESDKRVTVVLGDIGVHSFRKTFAEFPNNIYNIGILEQSMVSLSAGMSSQGVIPVIHTIAPFLVERAFEQIKIDFAYQALQGNLVSVGGSYDYAALGCTHHCPGDVGILRNIPLLEIYTPGNAKEFRNQFEKNYSNGMLSYFRLSERQHSLDIELTSRGAGKVMSGNEMTVICVGPIVEDVWTALRDHDVTIIYLSSLNPIDLDFVSDHIVSEKILLISNLYAGTLLPYISPILEEKRYQVKEIGTPNKFLRNYGNVEEHDKSNGLDPESIREIYLKFAKTQNGK
jgi:transketolase